jgi:hypothetical protein
VGLRSSLGSGQSTTRSSIPSRYMLLPLKVEPFRPIKRLLLTLIKSFFSWSLFLIFTFFQQAHFPLLDDKEGCLCQWKLSDFCEMDHSRIGIFSRIIKAPSGEFPRAMKNRSPLFCPGSAAVGGCTRPPGGRSSCLHRRRRGEGVLILHHLGLDRKRQL